MFVASDDLILVREGLALDGTGRDTFNELVLCTKKTISCGGMEMRTEQGSCSMRNFGITVHGQLTTGIGYLPGVLT